MLDRAGPFELHVGTARTSCDLKVVAIFAEKVVRRKQLSPGRRPDKDAVYNFGGCRSSGSGLARPRRQLEAHLA